MSKSRLDIDWLGKPKAYDNIKSTISTLIKDMQELKEKDKLTLIICEATGGYEQKIVRACHEAKLPIHVAHPNKVRHFAKSKGLLAKTDGIDAKVLSNYGELLLPKADSILLNENTAKIAEKPRRREQLQADKKRETNRIDKELSEDITENYP